VNLGSQGARRRCDINSFSNARVKRGDKLLWLEGDARVTAHTTSFEYGVTEGVAIFNGLHVATQISGSLDI